MQSTLPLNNHKYKLFQHCHTGVIELNDDNKAEIIGDYCIGCGTCARHCPENAIALITGQRSVRIPPPRQT